MNRSTFTRDNRAVAPVIGFILILGFLVLLLAIYQAQIVPQQNAETELEHHQETRDELRSLHSAISAVGADDSPRFQSINLGTAYESRTLGVNPPPAAGTIRTEQHNITIANQNGSRTNISTQFIEYQPGYNELDIGSTWYENSVLYFDERDRGNSVGIIEDQQMVQGDNVSIIALQNEFQEAGTGRVTFELYPSNDVENVSLPEKNGSYTVKVPTRINETEYWDDAFADTGSMYQGVDDTGDGAPDLLNLSVEPDALELNSVGIQLAPSGTETEPSETEEAAENLEPEQDEDGTLEGGGGAGASGQFRFNIINNGDNTLNIFAIGIINTTAEDADEVSNVNNNNPTFTQDDDLINDPIQYDNSTDDADPVEFDDNKEVQIEPDENLEGFEFFRFRNDSGDNAAMQGETVNIIVWVRNEDGDESQATLKLKDE